MGVVLQNGVTGKELATRAWPRLQARRGHRGGLCEGVSMNHGNAQRLAVVIVAKKITKGMAARQF
jgi:hypothetical protein